MKNAIRTNTAKKQNGAAKRNLRLTMGHTLVIAICATAIAALAILAAGCGESGVNSGGESKYLNMFLDVFSKNPGHNHDTTGTPTTPATYTLSVNVSPVEGGMVSRDIEQSSYEAGTQVTVTATPKPDYEFSGWSGASNAKEPAVTVIMDGDKALSAVFQKIGANVPTYTVYFNANVARGDAPEAMQWSSGTQISLPGQAGMVRDKYSFAGWNTEADGSGESYNAYDEYTVTRTTTLFAKWTRNPYTLLVTASPQNGGTVSRNPNKETYTHGEQVTITATPTPASGYTFKGWSGASSSTNATITIIMDDDKALTAGFGLPDAKRFTVYFNANGGGNAPDAASADSGANITLPDQQTMEKNGGYRFDGWNLKNDGTGTNYAANSSYKVTGGVTLYAKWIRVYTVTYNGNGTNSGVPNAVDTDSGTAVTLPGQGNMTRTGYNFDGWNTRDDGNGTNYAAGSSYTATSNVTLYAKWTRIAYTVTWNTDSGSPAPTQTSVNHGDSITAPAAMTKTGYTFDKWYTNSTLTTAATFPIRNVTANTTLYAKWTPNTYIVTFDAGSGTVSPTSGATNADGKLTLTSLPTPERSGYTFNGWFTSATNGTRVTIDRVYSDNTTIYAQWTAVPTYNVTVSGGGAGAAGGGSYAAGVTVSISAGTAPAGQAFDKWTTSNSGVSFANANSATTTFTMPGNAVTVTATWKQAFTDGRDNKTYKKVVIGGKTWMAENLNYVTSSGSWCYNNSTDSCAKYGRLYTWDAAMAACPMGWHLPSRDEWNALVTATGGSSVAGKALKSQTGWDSYSGITNEDTYGFSALPGGYRRSDGTFFGAGGYGFWWTATEFSGDNAYYRDMNYLYDDVYEYSNYKSNGFAVRCVEGAALYAVTVTGGTGSGNYAAGATVSISAGTAPTGQVFDKWTASGVTIANPNSASMTFTMPPNAVTVTATWKQASTGWVDGGTLNYGGQDYRTVIIGGKRWMAENLNYATSIGSWCYDNSTDNCTKYGRLYDWATAMGIGTTYNSSTYGNSAVKHQGVCPSGWHLPSREEWGALAVAAGGTGTYGTDGTAGKALKSTSGWNSGDNGTDDFGFSALPGGLRLSTFYGAVSSGLGGWWTATEFSIGSAYTRTMYYLIDIVEEYNADKANGISVRCVQD